ncbi:glycosyltransferase [Mesorhizobium sp. LHD-90]|nr:tetratricopeptide repeat protein [Mesorhizobium sp. LHD-90]MDQ6436155.1 glycosyltransferase [Mesorhizobium sp. LHD-90]
MAKLGRFEEAQAALSAGLKLAPKSADLLFELATHLRRAGQFKDADAKIQYFAKFHRKDRRLPQLRAGLAEAIGDLAWAERIYSIDVADHPDDESQRLRWARCLARMGRSEEARTVLLAGLDLAPGSAGLLVELASQLRKAGRAAEASARLEDLAKHHPDHPMSRQLQALQAEASGDFTRAANLLAGLVAAAPRDQKQRLRLVRCLVRLGRQPEALGVLSKGLGFHPTSSDLLAQTAILLRKSGMVADAGDAVEAFRRHHPSDPRLMQLMGAQAEATGDLEAAQRYFALDCDSAPDDAARRVRLANSMRKSGRIAEALQVLSRGAATSANERKVLIECLIESGEWDQVPELLDEWPQEDDAQQWIVRAKLRMRLAILQFDHATAMEIAQSILERAPDDARAGIGLSRAAAATFQPDRAWKALLDIPRTPANGGPARRGTGALRSLVGQIVNELRLRPAETKALHAAIVEGDETLVEVAGAQLRSDPGNFGAALGLLTGLARTGGSETATFARSDATSPRIPQILHQFWDKDQPPQDVAKLMDVTKESNAGCAYCRWSDTGAREFLATFGRPEPMRAYRAAKHAAMKSDIFRLAVLYVEGGIYLDADDFCAAPLSTLLPRDAEFVCYQDEFGSIGNNFLAATPRHPVIGAALQEAAQSVIGGATESIWLVTGPGLISRVVSASIARTPDLRPSPGLTILPLRVFHSVVHPHRRVSYKTDKRHWLRAA